MFEKFKKDKNVSSKCTIGKNSSNNVIFQGNDIQNINISNVELNSSDVINEIYTALENNQCYNAINTIASSNIKKIQDALKMRHPNYPYYSPNYDSGLGKFISTPQNKEALEKFPKSVKHIIKVDSDKYKHFIVDKETLWEYAYRTQTKVQVDTIDYIEYLGDRPDPYPRYTSTDKFITIISPPPFPEAVDACIFTKDKKISFKIKRIPCMEYGKIIFRNISENLGFNIELSFSYDNDKLKKPSLTFSKLTNCDLNVAKKVNDFFISAKKYRRFSLGVKNHTVLINRLSDNDLSDVFFVNLEFEKIVYDSLLSIQNYYNIYFDKIGNISYKDGFQAYCISQSIKGKWVKVNSETDIEILKVNDISKNLLDDFRKTEFVLFIENYVIDILGKKFIADKYTQVYNNAMIDNADTILNDISMNKENISISIKPAFEKEKFLKYIKYDGIHMIN